MNRLKLFVFVIFTGALVLPAAFYTRPASGQTDATGTSVDSDPPLAAPNICAPTEAPVGFDDTTNGLVSQDTHFNVDIPHFSAVKDVPDGLGPIYNAQSCRECHFNTVIGGPSQVTELRAGHDEASTGNFVPATVTIYDEQGNAVTISNRSLINMRAICPAVRSTIVVNGQTFDFPESQAQEHVSDADNIRRLRISLPIFGDGFVEAINSNTLAQISNNQPAGMQGQLVSVPVLEASGALRVGRFGWKDQQPSLLSFAGDASLNEMGISNPLMPADVTNVCDIVPDPEDSPDATTGMANINFLARFMRATKAPPRDTNLINNDSTDVQAGQHIFETIGCAICHVETIQTAPAGTVINGGKFTVPAALGCKLIHPYSDFLLHNVGTGDNIVQTNLPGTDTLDQSTAEKVRTPPLWGLRLRERLMHDGLSYTVTAAINRHAGEATSVITSFHNLNATQKTQLMTFLRSL